MSQKYVRGFFVGASTRKIFLFGIVLAMLAGSDAMATKQISVTPSPASVSFGSVTIGTSSTQTVTLSNTGRWNVTIASMGTSGPGFAGSGPTLPFVLAPGASIVFQVSFSPGNAGSATGSVYWSEENGKIVAAVPLSGDAVNPVHSATLNWVASTSIVVGYYVYRGSTSGGPYSRITATAVAATSYTDSTVQAGATYYYVVTALDSSNNESVYSSEVQAVIPSP